jgi:hypothetical protein
MYIHKTLIHILAINICCIISYLYSSDFNTYTSYYPAMTAFTDQYSLPNIFFDIGQL